MDKKTFNKVGDMEDKVTWNAAGTRKWRMTYTLLEVKPSWRKSKAQAAKEDSNKKAAAESKPKRAAKAKPKKATRPKKATKTRARSKTAKAKSKK